MSQDRADESALPAETAVGRVGLRVASLDDVLPFYRDAIGTSVSREGRLARLSAPGGRELLVLEEVPGAPPRPRSAAGRFHVAIRLPDRPSLGDALGRLRDAGGSLDGASDHLVSEALYLRDPLGNGVELYRDRPRDSWARRADGRVEMDTLPLDLGALQDAAAGDARDSLPDATDVGHVHLEVSDLAASTAFYVDGVGLAPSSGDYPDARFLAAGGYHHHVGLNAWNRRTDPVGDHQGLRWFELVLPDGSGRERAVERLERTGVDVHRVDDGPAVADPDGVEVRLALASDRARR